MNRKPAAGFLKRPCANDVTICSSTYSVRRIIRFDFQTADSVENHRATRWLLAMTANMSPRSRGAMRPSCARITRPKQRAQGKPGARCTRSLAWCVENTRVSHHRFTGTPGLPCAMVLTVSFVISPVTGLSCHRRLRNTFRTLDASVGASGPHDFAVRGRRIRQRAAPVHRIPRPTSVTIAIRPSREGGMARS